jgi:hypothetical protein
MDNALYHPSSPRGFVIIDMNASMSVFFNPR